MKRDKFAKIARVLVAQATDVSDSKTSSSILYLAEI